MRTQFSDSPELNPEKAWVHLLPVPLEQSVSYGGGTKDGPGAILEASYQLENYDREFRAELALEYGVHCLKPVSLSHEPLGSIFDAVSRSFRADKFLGVLGGEHALTAPVVNAITEDLQEPLTLVWLDAHCDLRNEYEGDPNSHASVARRLLENGNVEQILELGIRSLCAEEASVLDSEERVRAWFVEDVHSGAFRSELVERLRGKRVYLSFDVDCLDPSIMPSTGTPEPDGLGYRQVDEIFKLVTEHSHLVAFDCVELAPSKGLHAPDFTVAKLLQRLMSLAYRSRKSKLE